MNAGDARTRDRLLRPEQAPGGCPQLGAEVGVDNGDQRLPPLAQGAVQ